ncbi:peptidyl-prolyl cis-trans isomerase FKBP5-like [Chenopodium quinoa]|uniref:peptidyl-prolyl cis-trans isomerase FKBP5-like n=1 Tax=Chenopodium quinoa TaxID=63459 RepID=UPI000B77BEB0|nr:peptidyl-prolyl cis-trans isomerase FKBP5-like [Chenopodium quinoa]
MDCRKLRDALVHFHLNDDFYESIVNFVKNNCPRDILNHAKIFKEEGNVYFKKGEVVLAGAKYDRGLKLLCFVLPRNEDDSVFLRTLAISLELNLAACALKLRDYEQTKELCSLVIILDDNNTKALYRRALAEIKFFQLEEAFEDLSKAVKAEPNNQDISRELEKVEGLRSWAEKEGSRQDKPKEKGQASSGHRRGQPYCWTSQAQHSCRREVSNHTSTGLTSSNNEGSSIEEGSEVPARDLTTTDNADVKSVACMARKKKQSTLTPIKISTEIIETLFTPAAIGFSTLKESIDEGNEPITPSPGLVHPSGKITRRDAKLLTLNFGSIASKSNVTVTPGTVLFHLGMAGVQIR